jgi:MFS transporter, DHA2 family, multidrug resistance protein
VNPLPRKPKASVDGVARDDNVVSQTTVNRCAVPARESTSNDQVRDYPDKLDTDLLKIAGVCVLASVMAILDATVVIVAQQTFIAEFSSTYAVVAWTMTGYTLSLAMVIPLTGWAAQRFGTKRLFLSSLLFFSVGSLLCAMALNINMLVISRTIQGVGAGMLVPLPVMILTREAGPNRLGRLMAVTGVPMMFGPIAGPILGGWLIDSLSWRWIFLINLPIGFLALMLAATLFPKDEPSPVESFDLIGLLLLSPGLGAFLYGVSSIPEHRTAANPHVYIPASIGLLLITTFVFHALYRTRYPLIDLRLFRNEVVTLANVTMFLFVIAFFGVELLFPGYFQQLLSQTRTQSGMHLVPLALGAVLSMPIAGRYMDKRGPGKVVLVGIALVATGMGAFAYGVSQHTAYTPVLLLALLGMGMGTGCTLTPISASAMRALRPTEVARGATLLHVNRQVAGAIGTALMSTILTDQLNRGARIPVTGNVTAQMRLTTGSTLPPNLSNPSLQMASSNLMEHINHDLPHAYAVVFAVAVGLVVLAITPALFLSKKSAQPSPTTSTTPILEH